MNISQSIVDTLTLAPKSSIYIA